MARRTARADRERMTRAMRLMRLMRAMRHPTVNEEATPWQS
ncbi:hypothetical protein C7S13_7639 [Burkholderia cepacia]|nr:hypothetical protein [Burkholderia cepacia]